LSPSVRPATIRVMPDEIVQATLHELVLAERLERLKASYPDHPEFLASLEGFIRTADDRDIVRINPIQFARQHELAAGDVVALFLHARKIGLVTMEWQYGLPRLR